MNEHPLIKNVERAVHFLASEIEQERVPTLEAVSSASGLSKYHFHRLYRLVTGETVQATTTRLRIARAAAVLRDEKTSITDAAFVAGYASSQAFAKAVKRELAQSASDLRADPERLAASIRTLAEPVLPPGAAPSAPLRIEICSLDPFEIIIVRTKDKYPELAQAYWTLFSCVGDRFRINAVLGIPHRDIESFAEAGFIFDCALCVSPQLPEQPAGIEQQVISRGHYLIVRHTGPDNALTITLDTLYAYVLTEPDFMVSDAPCIHHFIDDPEVTDEADCRTDIYLKIDIAAGSENA